MVQVILLSREFLRKRLLRMEVRGRHFHHQSLPMAVPGRHFRHKAHSAAWKNVVVTDWRIPAIMGNL